MKFRIVSLVLAATLVAALLSAGTQLSNAQGTATPVGTVSVITNQITGGGAAVTATTVRQPTATLPTPVSGTFSRGIALRGTAVDGVPAGFDPGIWQEAFGTVIFPNRMGSTPQPVVIRVANLVPNGIYTLWWGGEGAANTLRPLVNLPDAQFQADENGFARAVVFLNLRSLGNRLTITVIYHASGNTQGDVLGRLKTDAFRQLVSVFPDFDLPTSNTTGGNVPRATRVPSLTSTIPVTVLPTLTNTATVTTTATLVVTTLVPTGTTATATTAPTETATLAPTATTAETATDVPTAVPSETATLVPTDVPTDVPTATP
jgi:hypothetical protein